MSENPNNPFSLWQELKRRKVIRVVIAYLAVSYVILELTSIIAEPFGLPGWTIKLVFGLLCVLLVVVAIFAWIFDWTPEGVKKTESQEAVAEQVSAAPAKRKFRVSDLIIAILLIAVGILAYPRMFKKDRLAEVRNEEGKISVAVMPFENLTGDTLYNVWQGGFQNLLISALSNSTDLQVRQYQTMSNFLSQKKELATASMSPALAQEIARDLEISTLVLGKILKSGNQIRLYAQLVNAETEDVYKTYQVDCQAETEVFTQADSLGNSIRNFLEIRKIARDYDPPELTVSSHTTSAEAFRYYISAWEAYESLDINTTIQWLTKAIELDAMFIEAYIFMSFAHASGLDFQPAKIWCDKAYALKEKFPVRGKLYLDHLHAYFYETPYEEIGYCKQLLELDEMNTTYWHFIADANYKLEQYAEAVAHWEKALKIHRNWGTSMRIPFLYMYMGDALHQLGNYEREIEIYEMGLNVMPNNPLFIYPLASCALLQGNHNKATEYINKFRAAAHAHHWTEARISTVNGILYEEAGRIDEALPFYRKGFELDPDHPSRVYGLASFLIEHDINVDEGVELARNAAIINPQSPMILNTYGWGLYKQGKYQEAKKVLQGALENRGPYMHSLVKHMEAVETALAEQR